MKIDEIKNWEEMRNEVVNADCLEAMKLMPNNCVDSIVTDPPAGISFMGKEWDTFDKNMFGKKGEEGENDLKIKKDFDILPRYGNADLMGFQNFICQVFTEAIRVLKPGGYALVWAIPRTSHHAAMGLERAGFEIRDVVSHIFSTGFPKSLNIGKQIDKIQNRKREIIGENPNKKGRKYDGSGGFGSATLTDNGINKGVYLSKGTSEFEGWGTALKPAVEHWILCRKPLSEKNVASNVLKWGTGGINIDGSRIGNESISVHNAPKGTFAGGEEGRGSDTESYRNHQGRFPSNLILSCICDEVIEGKEFVSGSFPEERGETAFFGLNKKHSHRIGQVKDKVKIHTNPDCPCAILDRQSGVLKSGKHIAGRKNGSNAAFGKELNRINDYDILSN